MGNAITLIRGYVLEQLRATRAALPAVAAHARSREISGSEQAAWAVDRLLRMLNAHADELAEHLQRLGGGALTGEVDSRGSAAQAPATAGAKALRDEYSMLGLAHAARLMLETHARTLGFSSTAALASRHREEIGKMLAEIRELLPLAA